MGRRILLVDGLSVFKEGCSDLKVLFDTIRKYKVTNTIIVWGTKGNTYKRELCENYDIKCGGNNINQCEVIKTQKLFYDLGLTQIKSEGIDYHDLLGSLTEKLKKEKDTYIYIWTNDNSVLQLADLNVSILKGDGSYLIEEYTTDTIEKELNISYKEIVDFMSLLSVKGINKIFALSLIKEYENIETLYSSIEHLSTNQKIGMNLFWKEDLGIVDSPLNILLSDDIHALIKVYKKLLTIKRNANLKEAHIYV